MAMEMCGMVVVVLLLSSPFLILWDVSCFKLLKPFLATSKLTGLSIRIFFLAPVTVP